MPCSCCSRCTPSSYLSPPTRMPARAAGSCRSTASTRLGPGAASTEKIIVGGIATKTSPYCPPAARISPTRRPCSSPTTSRTPKLFETTITKRVTIRFVIYRCARRTPRARVAPGSPSKVRPPAPPGAANLAQGPRTAVAHATAPTRIGKGVAAGGPATLSKAASGAATSRLGSRVRRQIGNGGRRTMILRASTRCIYSPSRPRRSASQLHS